jgi:hypothetical protein
MTPQERQLVSELFDRLASLEKTQRDPDAERVITQGFTRAPNAAYALVQTVLVQDEALKRAEAHIQQLESGNAPQESGGFLDSMRSAIFGGNAQPSRGSVPSFSPNKWNSGQVGGYPNTAPQQQQAYQQPEPPRGGSFLGTAAAAAAGVIGGSMLFSGLSSMMGGNRGQAFASDSSERGSPWGGDQSNSELAKDAGLGDIGGGGGRSSSERGGASSLFGNDDNADDSDFADSGDFGGGDSSDA